MIRFSTCFGSAALLSALAAAGVSGQVADSPPAAPQSLSISGSGPVSGVANVNSAAGNNNQQVNLGVVATGDSASALGNATQHIDGPQGGGGNPASTLVTDGAFAGSSGWIAVNGAAGSENQQANVALIAFGIEGRAVADAMLSQTRASQEPAGSPAGDAASPERIVAIGADAFEGSSGLVQLSLIGGDRNSSANVFALSVSGGAKP